MSIDGNPKADNAYCVLVKERLFSNNYKFQCFYSTIELIPTLPLQREGIVKHYDSILICCQKTIIYRFIDNKSLSFQERDYRVR
jgi:hypothetical protein